MAWSIHDLTVAKLIGCLLVMCILEVVHSQDVRRPPMITQGPSGQYVTKMGGTSVEIPCEASGSPMPTEFQWFRNGAQLDLNNQNIYRSDHTKGTITITAPSIFDEGYYQCTARNDWGTARSDVGQVIMATLGGYPALTVKSIKVDEGSFQMLICDPTKVSPNATFSWGVTTSTTDPSVVPVALSERISMDAAGNLYFGYVIQADWRNGQIYKCQVKNPWLDQMVGGSYVTMAVTPTSVTTVKPLVRYSTQSVIGIKGRDVELRCIFSGRDSPKIMWERADGFGVLPVGRFESLMSNTNLKIRDLAVSDKGTYKCSATNLAGSAQQMISLDVKVIPEFVKADDGPRNMNVTDGEDVIINCKTYADPGANVIWYINGYSFQANNRRRVSHDGLTLTLISVCRSCGGSSDLMVVSCNASNEYGYAYSSGYINVLKKTLITEAPVDTKMEYPYDINMTCGGVSDPSTPVNVEWYDHDNNRLYNQTDHFEITQNAQGVSRLRIIIAHDDHDLGVSRAGIYVCIVSNGVSNDSRSVQVFKPSEQGTVVASASILDNWWILLIILAAVLLLLIFLLVCFVCLRNKGDVYKVDESEVKNGNNPRQELLDTGYKGYMRAEPEGPLRGSRASLGSQMSLNSETSLAEYEADYGKFNEEGSFIGAYKGDQRTPAHATNV